MAEKVDERVAINFDDLGIENLLKSGNITYTLIVKAKLQPGRSRKLGVRFLYHLTK